MAQAQMPTRVGSLSERVVVACLHAVVCVVPLLMANASLFGAAFPTTRDLFELPKVFALRLIVSGAMIAWTWGAVSSRRLRVSRSLWLLVAFLAWGGLSTVFSLSPVLSLAGSFGRQEGLSTLVAYACLLWLALQVMDSTRRVRALGRTMFVTASVVAAYGLLQYVGWDPAGWDVAFPANQSFSTLGNPNFLGNYLVLALGIGGVLLLDSESVRERALYWAGMVVVTGSWITAFTRGAWAGGLVVLVCLAVIAFRWRPRFSMVDAVSLGVLGGGVVGLAALSITSGSALNLWTRLSSALTLRGTSSATRVEIWGAATRMVRDRPLTGHGLETFGVLFPHYQTASYVRDAGALSLADNAHDYPLHLAATVGVPGGLLLYAFFAVVIWLGVRHARSSFGRREDALEPDRDGLLRAGFPVATVGYLTALLFSISVIGGSSILWIALGIVLVPAGRVVMLSPVARWPRAVAVVLSVLMMAAFVGAFIPLAADHDYAKAKAQSEDPAAGALELRSAVRLAPYVDLYRQELGEVYREGMLRLLGVQGGSGAPRPSADAASWFKEAETAMREAIGSSPRDIEGHKFLASLYNQGGLYFDRSYYHQAVQTAEQGLTIAPLSPSLLMEAGFGYAGEGNLSEATTLLERATTLSPGFATAWVYLGDVYVQAGQLAKAERAYETALALNPGDVDMRSYLQGALASVRGRLGTATAQ